MDRDAGPGDPDDVRLPGILRTAPAGLEVRGVLSRRLVPYERISFVGARLAACGWMPAGMGIHYRAGRARRVPGGHGGPRAAPAALRRAAGGGVFRRIHRTILRSSTPGDSARRPPRQARCRPRYFSRMSYWPGGGSSAVKYAQSGWWNTSALTLASGSIIMPSVRSTPMSSGSQKLPDPCWSSRLGQAG